jgi:L-ascorbate metabolism protein UlaG (beta-lactamase superfamily)
VVIGPAKMPSKDIIDLHPAAITNTHTHADHNDPSFSRSYDCPRLSYVEGVLDTKDFHIYSILSSHFGDNIQASDRNVIIVYEVDGIRIAQMADIGQTKLTDDQLTKLGDIDIAIMQFNNSWSKMTLENEKGFNLMDQLKPKIIITTNEGEKDFAALTEHYGDITEVENMLSISKEEIPDTPCHVYHLTNTHKYN